MDDTKTYTLLDQHVIRTLLYFDIFNYPLKAGEVYRFLGMNTITEKDVSLALDQLAEDKCLNRMREFYGLSLDEIKVQRRERGNDLAARSLPLAIRCGQLIAKFPFVRAVFASGSLSKDYMDEKSDLDFFIVTAPQRLWFARTLIIIYKRMFLRKSKSNFCVNYFVDEDHLLIEEQNQFTATELATVIPLSDVSIYHRLIDANAWIRSYFPNFKLRKSDAVIAPRFFAKKTLELIMNPFAKPLELLLMRLTLRRWKRIYGQEYADAEFKIAFKTKKYASKSHPKHYQLKVLDMFQQKLDDFSSKHKIPLSL
jgi:hypothetical protein